MRKSTWIKVLLLVALMMLFCLKAYKQNLSSGYEWSYPDFISISFKNK